MRVCCTLTVLLGFSVFISACKVKIEVPEGGEVVTVSGNYHCPESEQCAIDVVSPDFKETFIARPKEGYRFLYWERNNLALCGNASGDCSFDATPAKGNADLLPWFDEDIDFPLKPVWAPLGDQWNFDPADQLIVRKYEEDRIVEVYGSKDSNGIWQRISQVVVIDDSGVRRATIGSHGSVVRFADSNGDHFRFDWLAGNRMRLTIRGDDEEGVRREFKQVIDLPPELARLAPSRATSQGRTPWRAEGDSAVIAQASGRAQIPVEFALRHCGTDSKVGDDAYDVIFEVKRESGKVSEERPVYNPAGGRWVRNLYAGRPLSQIEQQFFEACRLDQDTQFLNDEFCDAVDAVEVLCLESLKLSAGFLAPVCVGLSGTVGATVGQGCGAIPFASAACKVAQGTVLEEASQNILKVRAVATPRRSLEPPLKTPWKKWDPGASRVSLHQDLDIATVAEIVSNPILDIEEPYFATVKTSCLEEGAAVWLVVHRATSGSLPRHQWERVYIKKSLTNEKHSVRFLIPGAPMETAVDEISVYYQNPAKLAQKPAARKLLRYQSVELETCPTDDLERELVARCMRRDRDGQGRLIRETPYVYGVKHGVFRHYHHNWVGFYGDECPSGVYLEVGTLVEGLTHGDVAGGCREAPSPSIVDTWNTGEPESYRFYRDNLIPGHWIFAGYGPWQQDPTEQIALIEDGFRLFWCPGYDGLSWDTREDGLAVNYTCNPSGKRARIDSTRKYFTGVWP